MKKRLYYVYLLVLIIVGIFAFQYKDIHFSHQANPAKNYLYLFKDSIIQKIDTAICFSWVSKKDILNHYIYYEDLSKKKEYYDIKDTTYNNYYISIWDFKQLRNTELDDVFLNTNSKIDKSDFGWDEVLNPTDFICPITIKSGYNLDGMILNVQSSKIIKEYNTAHYKGFYGLVDKISICNKDGEPLIYFNFVRMDTPTMLLLYKTNNNFFLIQINARKRVDERIINIFDLK